jgi:hypothetical protein
MKSATKWKENWLRAVYLLVKKASNRQNTNFIFTHLALDFYSCKTQNFKLWRLNQYQFPLTPAYVKSASGQKLK